MDKHKYEYRGRRSHGTLVGRGSKTAWDLALTHRVQLLRLLPKRQVRSGTLCVFGVGDGTSLDLAALLKRFHEVHLVDRDGKAMDAAIRSQNLFEAQRIFRHTGVDPGGVSDLLERYAATPNESLLDELLAAIGEHRFPDLGEFDCVLSSSLLSGLTRSVAASFGEDVQAMLGPLLRIRDRHIELMLDHALPGGDVFLVTDFVSSETLPALAETPDDLVSLCRQAIEASNFYPGVSPVALEHLLSTRPQFRDQLTGCNTSAPWIHEHASHVSACVALWMHLKPQDPASPGSP